MLVLLNTEHATNSASNVQITNHFVHIWNRDGFILFVRFKEDLYASTFDGCLAVNDARIFFIVSELSLVRLLVLVFDAISVNQSLRKTLTLLSVAVIVYCNVKQLPCQSRFGCIKSYIHGDLISHYQ